MEKVQTLCFPHTHTAKNLTSPNCKIPLGACFINTSHSSSGLPTEDYGELLECHLCFPDQWGASTVAKHGEQRDQPRLDTCIPDTRGWCPVRKHTKLSRMVQKQQVETGHKSTDQLSAQQPYFVWSLVNVAARCCFRHNTVCSSPWAYITDKYRLNLTGVITFTICSVLWCWQCCWGPQMSSFWGVYGCMLLIGAVWWQFATSLVSLATYVTVLIRKRNLK